MRIKSTRRLASCQTVLFRGDASHILAGTLDLGWGLFRNMRIGVLTAGRSDYGIYFPLLKAIENSSLNLRLMVTGTHLLPEYGETESQIVEDGFEISSRLPFATGHMDGYISPKNFDWLVVLGDTWPMLEGCILAAKQNIPIAHIHGGDKTGSIDESIRHAITRFAHLHFPSLPEHAERLRRMGEEDWRITEVGPLGIYAMNMTFKTRQELNQELGLDSRPIGIVIQHPVWQELNSGEQMKETLEALFPKIQPVVFYPNADLGSEEMIKVIQSYPFQQFKSLPYPTFLSLMREASVMIGNSSSAIVEAPLFGLPVVNIGTRQHGRRQRGNVQNVGYHKKEIERALKNALGWPHVGETMERWPENGPQLIVDRLLNEEVNERLLQKRLTY